LVENLIEVFEVLIPDAKTYNLKREESDT